MKESVVERVIWGDGIGSLMPVFETEIGKKRNNESRKKNTTLVLNVI